MHFQILLKATNIKKRLFIYPQALPHFPTTDPRDFVWHAHISVLNLDNLFEPSIKALKIFCESVGQDKEGLSPCLKDGNFLGHFGTFLDILGHFWVFLDVLVCLVTLWDIFSSSSFLLFYFSTFLLFYFSTFLLLYCSPVLLFYCSTVLLLYFSTF